MNKFMKDSITQAWMATGGVITLTSLNVFKEWLNLALILVTIVFTIIKAYGAWMDNRKKGGRS